MNEEIQGAVISIRTKGDKLGIWTRDASKQEENLELGLFFDFMIYFCLFFVFVCVFCFNLFFLIHVFFCFVHVFLFCSCFFHLRFFVSPCHMCLLVQFCCAFTCYEVIFCNWRCLIQVCWCFRLCARTPKNFFAWVFCISPIQLHSCLSFFTNLFYINTFYIMLFHLFNF